MNQYFRDFYQNWTNKAAGITGNNLSDVYDKYMTLFVIFNNLHNQIPDKLISLRVALPNRIQDNKAATEMVIKFLGADDFLNLLRSNGLEDDITLIIQLIQQEAFHIKLNYGQYNRNDDLTILAELQSPINTQKKKKNNSQIKSNLSR